MSETKAIETCEGLDISEARDLLQVYGYGLTCRFEHVHATSGRAEWHICLVAELALMHPSHFLACLEEAIKISSSVPESMTR